MSAHAARERRALVVERGETCVSCGMMGVDMAIVVHGVLLDTSDVGSGHFESKRLIPKKTPASIVLRGQVVLVSFRLVGEFAWVGLA